MIDLKYQCEPCHPFLKEKCFFCLKIRLKGANAIKALDDVPNREEVEDALSILSDELEFPASEELAA
jgi:hypothetical protein